MKWSLGIFNTSASNKIKCIVTEKRFKHNTLIKIKMKIRKIFQ